MYMVAKIPYHKNSISQPKPIYTNIPNTEEASYLAQLAILNNEDKGNSIIVIIPSNNPTLNMKTMCILDNMYKDRGDKHE